VKELISGNFNIWNATQKQSDPVDRFVFSYTPRTHRGTLDARNPWPKLSIKIIKVDLAQFV